MKLELPVQPTRNEVAYYTDRAASARRMTLIELWKATDPGNVIRPNNSYRRWQIRWYMSFRMTGY